MSTSDSPEASFTEELVDAVRELRQHVEVLREAVDELREHIQYVVRNWPDGDTLLSADRHTTGVPVDPATSDSADRASPATQTEPPAGQQQPSPENQHQTPPGHLF